MFGAVLSTGAHKRGAGQVRGPLQLTFAPSLHPIVPTDHAITRVTQTRQKDIDEGQRTEMGSKWTVPYGLYRAHAYFSAPRAAATGITTDDLTTLWQAITIMFDHDRSAARGDMKLCGLYIFSHPDALGVETAAKLTNRVSTTLINQDKAPRQHSDYAVQLDESALPAGIELTPVVNLWP